MLLLVGLGNPGRAYARHRHNVGFMAADAIARRHGFRPFRMRFSGLAQVTEGALAGRRVLILKPATYMNESGQATAAAARFYKIEADDIIVLHDELDLKPGKVRVKRGGSSAGHNGLRSLDAHLGPDYRRVRIGIGHPGDRDLVSDYVLHDFAKADGAWLDKLLDAVAEAAPRLADGDEAGFMNFVARTMAPPKPKPPPIAEAEEGSNHGV